jgi:hypothetical protein
MLNDGIFIDSEEGLSFDVSASDLTALPAIDPFENRKGFLYQREIPESDENPNQRDMNAMHAKIVDRLNRALPNRFEHQTFGSDG